MPHSYEYYISKGFDENYARYFAGGRRKITDVKPNDDFTLTLSFENSEKRIFDMKPLLKKGTVFDLFSDYENFKRVYIDEFNCVCWDKDPNIDSNEVWSNKVDLSPETCYVESQPIDDI